MNDSEKRIVVSSNVEESLSTKPLHAENVQQLQICLKDWSIDEMLDLKRWLRDHINFEARLVVAKKKQEQTK